MRKEFIATANKVFDRVSGKYFLVENGVAKEIDRNDQVVENGETVILTEANCRCFKTIDFKPEETPDVSKFLIKDGILVTDGEPVMEQGELKFTLILGGTPGYLYLLGTLNEESNVYSYRVCRKQLSKILTDIKPECLKPVNLEDENALYFVYTETKTIQIENEAGEKVDKEVLDTSMLVKLAKVASVGGADYVLEPSDVVKVGEKYYVGFSKDRELKDVSYGYTVYGYDLEYENEIQTGTKAVIKDSAAGVTIRTFELVIAGGVTIASPKLADVIDFNRLVEVNYADSTRQVVLANSERRTCVVTCERTSDRGNIVTVEVA